MPKVLLRHGKCTEEFLPHYVGTDYFTFYHRPCKEKPPYYGHCRIYAVIIDDDGRIIFNLQCRSCGARDALKTHPFLWLLEKKRRNVTQLFYFAPKYKNRCKPYVWDEC